MRKVVVVAPEFSPSSLPPALRTRFFVESLAELGWQATVLTVDHASHESAIDPANDRLVPSGVRVVRTPAIPTRWTRRFGFGDLGVRSLPTLRRALGRVCAEERPDLLFVTVPPYVTMTLARWAHDRYGVPYVVDFIDPWRRDRVRACPPGQSRLKWALAHALPRLAEPWALRRASHVVAVSRGMADEIVSRYPHLSEDDATEIPYGAPVDDFAFLREHRRAPRVFDPDDGLVRIGYIGVTNAGMEPTLAALFQGLAAARDRHPEAVRRLRLQFVGTTYAAEATGEGRVLPIARAHGVEALVDEHPGRVPYLDSLQLLVDCQALLVIGSDDPNYTASKVFPYILARRPLLAVVHEGSSVVDVVREARAGTVLTYGSHDGPGRVGSQIAEWLVGVAEGEGRSEPEIDWEVFGRYTTRSMTKRLVSIFDAVVERRLPVSERVGSGGVLSQVRG